MDKERIFNFVKGPVFATSFWPDEITDTSKNAGALLESMQEYSVTIAGQRLRPATAILCAGHANPSSRKVPTAAEAQLDRFMFSIFP